MKNKSLGQWFLLLLGASLIIVAGTAATFTFFTVANYSDTVERLVYNFKSGDNIGTKNELIKLNYFYELSKQWKVQWLADKYLFKDSAFYNAGDIYLTGDWQKVIEDLQDKQEDVRAYPYGNAKFRQAQSQYQGGQKKEALESVTTDVAEDFEKALRICLDSKPDYNDCFDRVWNYDLVTNKKDAEEALKNPQQKPAPKFMLGPIKDKGKPMKVPGDKEKKGDGKEGEEKGGQGGPRKRP